MAQHLGYLPSATGRLASSPQLLEGFLKVSGHTISTLANRMTKAPLDEQLKPFAWDEHRAAGVAAVG